MRVAATSSPRVVLVHTKSCMRNSAWNSNGILVNYCSVNISQWPWENASREENTVSRIYSMCTYMIKEEEDMTFRHVLFQFHKNLRVKKLTRWSTNGRPEWMNCTTHTHHEKQHLLCLTIDFQTVCSRLVQVECDVLYSYKSQPTDFINYCRLNAIWCLMMRTPTTTKLFIVLHF